MSCELVFVVNRNLYLRHHTIIDRDDQGVASAFQQIALQSASGSMPSIAPRLMTVSVVIEASPNLSDEYVVRDARLVFKHLRPREHVVD